MPIAIGKLLAFLRHWSWAWFGCVRTISAATLLLTIVFTSPDSLFRNVVTMGDYPSCDSVLNASIYCIVEDRETAHAIVSTILVLVILGVFPQVTAFLHAWAAFSFSKGIAIPDGGDSVAFFVSVFLIPVAMSYPRWSHWARPRSDWPKSTSLLAYTGLVMMKVQLSIIYFHAGVSKLFQEEWQDGSAMYYILTAGQFGVSEPLVPLFNFLFDAPLVLAIFTWSVPIMEISLCAVPWLTGRARIVGFSLALALHLGIALLMGIVTFQLAMISALLFAVQPLRRSNVDGASS